MTASKSAYYGKGVVIAVRHGRSGEEGEGQRISTLSNTITLPGHILQSVVIITTHKSSPEV